MAIEQVEREVSSESYEFGYVLLHYHYYKKETGKTSIIKQPCAAHAIANAECNLNAIMNAKRHLIRFIEI